jgi:hypothetical protein
VHIQTVVVTIVLVLVINWEIMMVVMVVMVFARMPHCVSSVTTGAYVFQALKTVIGHAFPMKFEIQIFFT